MADPLQGWFGTTFPFECSQGLAVLGIRCRGLLDARPIRLQTRHVILSDIRPKNSDAPAGLQQEKQVVAAHQHGAQYPLHNGVGGIDQRVESLASVELKREPHHIEIVAPHELVPEPETRGRRCTGYFLAQAQGQEAPRTRILPHQPHGKTRFLCADQLFYELRIEAQWQKLIGIHAVRLWVDAFIGTELGKIRCANLSTGKSKVPRRLIPSMLMGAMRRKSSDKGFSPAA